MSNEAGDCFRCLCTEKPKTTSNLYEDKSRNENPLKNWDKWLERRKFMHARLKKMDRITGDMLLNVGDDTRFVNEERELFSHTNIEDTFDKWRGNPAFWNLPLSLPNKDPFLYRNPVYFGVESKQDKNEIPDITYVGTPDYILKEKDIEIGDRNLKVLWKKGTYRNETFAKKNVKIKKIEPHRPLHEDLVIVGTKMEIKPLELDLDKVPNKVDNNDNNNGNINEINENNIEKIEKEELVTELEEASTDSKDVLEILPQNIKFKINNIELFENCETIQVENRKIQILFEYQIGTNIPTLNYLFFENTGDVTVRFYWNHFEKFRLFREFPTNKHYPFYFNKNEIILIPGQKINFPMWFHPKKHGNYSEFWEITTLPKIWDTEFRLLVCLKGFAYIKDFKEKCECIRNSLEAKAGETIIKDIVADMLDNLKYPEKDKVVCNFDEKSLFESANMKLCVNNKVPKYVYNRRVIRELKLFYSEVREDNYPSAWDFSIENLKKITREKDIITFCEKKTTDYMNNEKRRAEMKTKDQQKKDTAAKSKTEEPQPAHLEQESYVKKLQKLLQKLERPAMIKNENREKHMQVHNIFTAIFSKMSQKLHKIDVIYGSNTPNFPMDKILNSFQEDDKLIFEKFDDIWLSRIKRVMPECKMEFQAAPKTPLLKNVDCEDVKKVFKAYFNKEVEDDDKKGKKKKEKEKAPEKVKAAQAKKGKGEKEKSNKTKSDIVEFQSSKIKENFDPFFEIFAPKVDVIIKEEDILEMPLASVESLLSQKDVSYERYLTIYNHLGEAIEAMVDCIETFKSDEVKLNVLSELKECNEVQIKHKPDSGTSIESPVFQNYAAPAPDKKSLKTDTTKSYSVESVGEKDLSFNREDNEYFDYLIKKHWKENKSTKKYIVNEKICKRKQKEDIVEKVKEEEPVNVFTDPSEWTKKKSLEHFSTCESKAMQTSEVENTEFANSDIFLDNAGKKLSEKLSDYSMKSADIFYFLCESLEGEEREGEGELNNNEDC